MTITGTLTDYALMTEGKHTGRYAARIDDKPLPVMSHVDAFLLKLQKGMSVDYTLKEIEGEDWISKIARSKAPVQQQKVVDVAGDAVEQAQARVDARKAEQERLKKAGFSEPTPAKQDAPITAPAVVERAPQKFDKDQVSLIKATVARNCTDTEFELLMYLSAQYGLDPIRRQIWAVKYGNAPASIFTGRDGFLEIAHRSGQFDGMESGIREEGEEIIGWCKVYRKDMTHAFYVEVYTKEYTTGKSLWLTKPRIMIQKVAESSCLRRAFSVSGLYCPEEMPDNNGGQ